MTETSPAPQDRLRVEVDLDATPPTITLTGDLDPHTSPHLSNIIDQTVDDASAGLVLDVGDVGFADSAGLRVFADTHRRLERDGAALTVRNPSDGLRRLLSITGLDEHLRVEPAETSDA